MRTVKVTEQTLPTNKTAWDVKQERNRGYGKVRNYQPRGSILEVEWGMNEDTERDKIVRIKIGKEEAWVNVEELLRYTRWV